MFHKKLEAQINDLDADLLNLEERISHLEEKPELKLPEPLDVNKLKNEIYKEVTDKYFSAMNDFMKSTKEMQLIEQLASQVKSEDIDRLRTVLMEPVLTQRWENEKEQKINKIDNSLSSRGAEILKKEKEFYAKYLEMGRTKQDTKEIEMELRALNLITESNLI